VFCHTPHRSSGTGPLWNRKASAVSFFKHYSSSTLAIDNIPASQYGQPNGSSRLCLSCHDGVTALGAVFTTAGSFTVTPIDFTNSKGSTGPNVSIGYETYSSHHPVSFKYDGVVINILHNPPYNKTEYQYIPTSNNVKLDSQQRMQCTTCHDPHQSKSDEPGTPFWAAKTYNEVCWTCHNVSPTIKTFP
jgi:predicted CXXCH cytochrome family protein